MAKMRAAIRRWPVVRHLANRKGLIAISAFGIVTIVGVLGPLLAPEDPVKINLGDAFTPPRWASGGLSLYVLGTDHMGRDIFSRVLYGSRVSLEVAFAAVGLAVIIGTSIALIAGYFTGTIGAVCMRVADVTLAFPALLLAMLFAVVFGPGFGTVVTAIGLTLWARIARVLRGEVLSVRERDFVLAAVATGCSDQRILLRHVLPHIMNTLLVLVTLDVGVVVLVEASLSFLGAGIPPPSPTLGSMVSQGRDYVTTAWWVTMFPGLAILVIILVYNLTGNWIRDALDPTLRGVG